MATRRFTSKEVAQLPGTYVGQYGELWIGDDDNTLRVGNNTTPGGIVVGNGGNSIDLTNTGVTFGVWLGDEVHFIKENDGSQVDQIAPGISITRGPQGYIFNAAAGDSYFPDEFPYVQNSGDPNVAYSGSPTNTEWNSDGWGDLSNVVDRTYGTWESITDNDPPGLVGQELVMYDSTNDAYYTVKFLSWQYGNLGGGFSYVRRRINIAARFTKTDYGSEVDQIAPGLAITRGENGGIYNADAEGDWDSDVSPAGTLWNLDGWNDLSDVTDRQYLTFYSILGANNLGKRVLGKPFVMKDTINNQYWKVQFTHWTPNGNGGGFSYVRERIDTNNLQIGITFADATNQVTAFTEQKLGIVPQLRYTQGYERWLNLADIGKHILVTQSGVTLIIPDYQDQAFPLGSAITIVNRSGGSIYVSMDNDSESNTIYGAGTTDTGTYWEIPDTGGGNIATLLKIEFNYDGGGDGHNWMLSGPGIALD